MTELVVPEQLWSRAVRSPFAVAAPRWSGAGCTRRPRLTLPTLADPGYEGAGLGILIPVKQPPGGGELDINTRTRNAQIPAAQIGVGRVTGLIPR